MEEKIKIVMEFPIHASPKMLYQYFGTSSGLSEWFADNVNSRGEIFTRFKWLESEGDDSYFEFRIEVDELTKDVSLMITDFSEKDEVEDSKMFWDNQIEELKHRIGA
jgi:uncharacterized protein YndB with AHSA1/START domain